MRHGTETRIVLAVIVLVAGGCGQRHGNAAGAWGEVEAVETLRIGQLDGPDEYLFGSVRYIAAGPGGEIIVADGQLQQVREYDRDGTFVCNIGRAGEGPGEYGRVQGLEVTPDGTVAVYSTGPGRIALFSLDGAPIRDLPVMAGYRGPRAFDVGRDGNFYVRTIAAPRRTPDEELRFTLLVIDTRGTLLARVPVPDDNHSGTGAVLYTPDGPNYFFATATRSAWSPLGYFVTGRNDTYTIELRDTTGVVGRFVHDYQPVPITGGERDDWEAWADAFGKDDPAARPPIPDVKPAFRGIEVGDEGLIWVRRQVAAVYHEQLPRPPGDDRPLLSWREPPTWDVFDPEGTFLGSVALPGDVRILARRGRTLWAAQSGDDGAQVVRYEVRTRL